MVVVFAAPGHRRGAEIGCLKDINVADYERCTIVFFFFKCTKTPKYAFLREQNFATVGFLKEHHLSSGENKA